MTHLEMTHLVRLDSSRKASTYITVQSTEAEGLGQRLCRAMERYTSPLFCEYLGRLDDRDFDVEMET